MSYSINLGAWNSVFAVPCSVVDNDLKLAGSVQLKVLLWVLRHAGKPFETQDIADALGIDRADVGDAMTYWRENGLISEKENVLSPVPAAAESHGTSASSFHPESPAEKQAETKAEQAPHHVLSRPEKPDSEFVAKRIAESKEIECLMQSAQQILGRLLSGGDAATLLLIHDDYGLPSDVIVMLMQYAASIGKPNMRYIEKAAINWSDNGVDTHEKAEEHLRVLTENQKAWRTVEESIGIAHRTPSHKEQEFAPVWVNEWKFSMPMIREAYDRTIDGAGKYQTTYMNRILERWHKGGITTPKQAADEDAERAAHRSAKSAAAKTDKERNLTFDIDEYERTSINDTKE